MKKMKRIWKFTELKRICLPVVAVMFLCSSCGSIKVSVYSGSDNSTVTDSSKSSQSGSGASQESEATENSRNKTSETTQQTVKPENTQTKTTQTESTQSENTQTETTQTESTQTEATSEKPPENTETETEEHTASVQSQPYILRYLYFQGKPIDDRTGFSADGTFTDAYMVELAEASYTAIFGRFAPVRGEKEAIRTISDFVKVSPDSIESRPIRISSSAFELQYAMVSDNNRKRCVDTLILMDDALHWFHREIDTGLFDEYLDYFQEQHNDLRILGLTDDMFHSMKPGDAAPVLAEVKYGSDNSIFVNDKLAVIGLSEDELKAHNIDPVLVEQGRLYVELGEDKDIEYPVDDTRIYTIIDYEDFYDLECSKNEFILYLKERNGTSDSGMLVNIYFIGNVPIIISEVSLS